MDDVFAALRDSIGVDGQLAHQSLSVFGFCPLPGQPSGSLLLELARVAGRKREFGLEILHPVGGTAAAEQTSFCCFCSIITASIPSSALVTEEVEMGTIELTFDLPDSPLLEQSAPVLLLALEAPPRGENLAVTFSSQSLQPDVQVTTQLKSFNLCVCH